VAVAVVEAMPSEALVALGPPVAVVAQAVPALNPLLLATCEYTRCGDKKHVDIRAEPLAVSSTNLTVLEFSGKVYQGEKIWLLSIKTPNTISFILWG
jgi:hypothetical protein